MHAGRISREHGSLMGKMKEVKAFEQELLEHIDMIKLAQEENDTVGISGLSLPILGMYSFCLMIMESLEALVTMRKISNEKKLEALLSGEQDPCPCYIEVQAGVGGTESMDWAAMVMEMYKSWAQRRGYGVTVVDEMPGEMAGIKRATIKVVGEYAFGYAKSEVGVHRLVRISPFDSGKRRHTSFAAVAVIPIMGDGSTRVQINESDLRIERYRAGGPGCQHANTTESAVRIVHIPTGVTATCQNERCVFMNFAKNILCAYNVIPSDQRDSCFQEGVNAPNGANVASFEYDDSPSRGEDAVMVIQFGSLELFTMLRVAVEGVALNKLHSFNSKNESRQHTLAPFVQACSLAVTEQPKIASHRIDAVKVCATRRRTIAYSRTETYVLLEPGKDEMFVTEEELKARLTYWLENWPGKALPRDLARFATIHEAVSFLVTSVCELELEGDVGSLQWFLKRVFCGCLDARGPGSWSAVSGRCLPRKIELELSRSSSSLDRDDDISLVLEIQELISLLTRVLVHLLKSSSSRSTPCA
ncbi:hypothetical protein LWI29_034540 [Acer saccharum]|uniref:Peptide chain release factor domain-containing protein n=1 Tax=Acer saccharum TaxID=4024 RepID=A0AA39T7I4_ACESA|nr:hypothetical protein LWI29_034540 [Acer saccharum]